VSKRKTLNWWKGRTECQHDGGLNDLKITDKENGLANDGLENEGRTLHGISFEALKMKVWKNDKVAK